MNQLVEANDCNMLVNTQLKDDRIYGTMPLTKLHKMNVIIRKKQTHSDLDQFLHGACFSPVKSTFLKSIKNKHFITWLGLDERLIQKHLLPSMATEAGCINQERRHLQSTSTNKAI